IPFTGQVDVLVKQDLKELRLRLPEWVKPDAAKCKVDGKPRGLTFSGRYAVIGPAAKGETVSLLFPISGRTERVHLQGKDYTVTLRGNTVVHVDPPGHFFPLYERDYFRLGRPMFKKVERFVPDNELKW